LFFIPLSLAGLFVEHEMTDSTCPHCGSASAKSYPNAIDFKCGSVLFGDGRLDDSPKCLRLQVKQQAAEIEQLKEQNERLKKDCGEVK
jgi:hypothetical protein